MASSSPANEEVRTLLRYVDNPEHLRGNRLAEKFQSEHLRPMVEGAICRLPWRARMILRRCDLGGELHRVVAHDLGICERYFYRERRRALQLLEELLCRDEIGSNILRASLEPDPAGVAIAYATALENVGQFAEAVATLKALATDAAIGETRARIELRIARLCSDNGQLALAQRHLDAGRAIINGLPISEPNIVLLSLEGEISKAKLLWATGLFSDSKTIAGRAVRKLLTINCAPFRERHAALSADALLLLAKASRDTGAFKEALSAALEARDVLQGAGMSGAPIFVEALVTLANIHIFTPHGLASAVAESSHAYALAERQGLARQCARIVSNLCGIHLFKGDLEGAAAFAREAMRIGRLVCSKDELVQFLFDLAAVQLLRHDLASAYPILTELRSRTSSSNVQRTALRKLFEADFCLVAENHRQALGTAVNVARTMSELGNPSFLGSALRVQAEAHHALGDDRAAIRAIDEAIDLHASCAQPLCLARTYASAARVTRKAMYIRAAQEAAEALSF
jgi:tetratricopeptide (TPR) repeat protein